eukprot:525483-Pleurochrysis_carterae.AAC.1
MLARPHAPMRAQPLSVVSSVRARDAPLPFSCAQLDAPLEIVVDGISRRGVVMKPGKPFDLYVGQARPTYRRLSPVLSPFTPPHPTPSPSIPLPLAPTPCPLPHSLLPFLLLRKCTPPFFAFKFNSRRAQARVTLLLRTMSGSPRRLWAPLFNLR